MGSDSQDIPAFAQSTQDVLDRLETCPAADTRSQLWWRAEKKNDRAKTTKRKEEASRF